jgi:hypothetical protein
VPEVIGDMDDKRLVFAARAHHAVVSAPRHSDHLGAIADSITERFGKRCEVGVQPLPSRRIADRRCGPVSAPQEARGGRVDQLRPRRKGTHMCPLRDGGCRAVARFDDQRF